MHLKIHNYPKGEKHDNNPKNGVNKVCNIEKAPYW